MIVGVLCLVIVLLCSTRTLSSFGIILMGKRELVVLLLLSFSGLVTVSVFKLLYTVLWGGLQWVIVVFPDRTHLRFQLLNRLSY